MHTTIGFQGRAKQTLLWAADLLEAAQKVIDERRTDTERLDALEKVPTHLRRLMLVGCEDRKWYVDSGQAGVLFRLTLRAAIDAYLDAEHNKP